MSPEKNYFSNCFTYARELIRLNSQILHFPMDLEWQTFSGDFVFINLKKLLISTTGYARQSKGETFKMQNWFQLVSLSITF